MMNKTLIILSLTLLASCGPSAEEKKNIAAVTCSIMGETRNMDAAVRVREMNDARKEMGGEPFLDGDAIIKVAIEYGLCEELVLGRNYNETLQLLKDMERIALEEEVKRLEIAAEKQKIADSKPSVKEEFHPNGKLKRRINYKSKDAGGKKDGLEEEYYEDGQLKQKGNFKDGELDGLLEYYYENGQLGVKLNYKDGLGDGPQEAYYDNGQLDVKENKKDGKLDGLYERYWVNGQLHSTYCYRNDEVTDLSYCEK